MKSRSTFAVTALAAAIALVGCNKPADGTAKTDAAKTDEAGADKKIPGLATEKDQISYMVGMDVAKMLEPAKDEVDFATVTKAMKDGRITPEEGREFLSNYRSGLYGYTYLEKD